MEYIKLSLIHIGATGIAFINENYAHDCSFPIHKLSRPRNLEVVDGRSIATGSVTHYALTTATVDCHVELLPFFLTSLGHYPVILGVQ
jgi:hypothetical protein